METLIPSVYQRLRENYEKEKAVNKIKNNLFTQGNKHSTEVHRFFSKMETSNYIIETNPESYDKGHFYFAESQEGISKFIRGKFTPKGSRKLVNAYFTTDNSFAKVNQQSVGKRYERASTNPLTVKAYGVVGDNRTEIQNFKLFKPRILKPHEGNFIKKKDLFPN
jgi:hypothetical protein